MDSLSYHRRRADQHRAMLVRGDVHYASIHQRMIDLHEERAKFHENVATADGVGPMTEAGA